MVFGEFTCAPRPGVPFWYVNVVGGKVTYAPVAEATGQPYTEALEALGALV